MLSTVQCYLLYKITFFTMLSTVQFIYGTMLSTVHSYLWYNVIYCTTFYTCTVQCIYYTILSIVQLIYCAKLSIVQCFLLYNVIYCTMLSTVPCYLWHNVIYCTKFIYVERLFNYYRHSAAIWCLWTLACVDSCRFGGWHFGNIWIQQYWQYNSFYTMQPRYNILSTEMNVEFPFKYLH